MATTSNLPADAAQRDRALAVERSFLVRAPAGSGKTELLTTRFLKLLAIVDEPEEILAITFTRAATAEMRGRVLKYLGEAAQQPETPDEEQRISLARAALARSAARGWHLLEQPHRLNIQTIDSLCLSIARNQPLLSRMGGALAPTENAEQLYLEAAQRTMERLGPNQSLQHLLALRDNNLAECADLVAGMLARRDQWIRALPFAGDMGQEEWEQARSRLEQPFRTEVKRVHGEAYRLLMAQPTLAAELVELARYACGNGNRTIAPLEVLRELPRPELMAVDLWRCIAHFLLTKNEWRKKRGLDVTFGFPKGAAQKERMGELLERFPRIDGLREALCAARDLPEPHYDDHQWETLRHIFTVLRLAVGELRVLFAERNTVDFTELSIAASDVLDANASPDLLLALSGNIRHLLVDEFQDTSRSQLTLLQKLIRAWDQDDGRTIFLVGDSMQSIYIFRQAEVELFDQVLRSGLVSEEHTVDCELVELATNFRSHQGLTSRWNEMFVEVFREASGAGHVRYSQTFAQDPPLPGECVEVYPQIIADGAGRIDPGEREAARAAEAGQVLKIVAGQQQRMQQAAARNQEYRVAVLVRARQHLAYIVKLLRERKIPFRAIELEKLNERQELIDLMSLVRALLHPMDRVAWLSVLRAPWCGLMLDDLHQLAGADDPAFRYLPMLELISQRLPLLSADGALRLQRVAGILKQALAARFEGLHATSFSQWIERTWRSLGGPQCIDAAAYENAQVFFAMLDTVTPDGMTCMTDQIEREMEHMFAQPDPGVSERAGLQLMTIHKAKGLGFDVVIVPGLDRQAAKDKPQLICSLERTNPQTGEPEMLVAPIGYRGADKHWTYAWVQRQRSQRADEELKRLLYVACTRARRSLHLLGTATLSKSGLKADARSLLAVGWPALQSDFEEELKRREKVVEDTGLAKVVSFPARNQQSIGLELAAGADSEALERPSLRLRRLPADIDLSPQTQNVTVIGTSKEEAEPPLQRPHGSRDARQKGSVVHALLEQLSRGVPLESLDTAARALLRNLAYSGKGLESSVADVLDAAKRCAGEPDGVWILAAHAQAQSETSMTGWKDGALETLRPDRVFVAGPSPRAPGEDHLWIVDYKMSVPAGDENFLLRQREAYAPQLTRYAQAFREAQGITLPVCFGLYYPGIAQLDWWPEQQSQG